jgi:2-polyprenyl-6-methoxyphenol hydroxylase-like FAD-dependent oxidoreductase
VITDKRILISGAGPSGLCAAIFLKEKGFNPRIIDKKQTVSPYSKAFAVNPRSLEILDEFGIAKRFIENGRKLQAMNIWRNQKVFFRNEFGSVKHKYPFLLIQSQRESELILREEAAKRNIEIEFGTQLLNLAKTPRGYSSTLQKGDSFTHESDIVVAADGSRSEVRTQSAIDFPGFGYRGTWELYDVELDIDIPEDDANLFLFDTGGMILIRIKNNLWRIAGSMPDLLNYLPKGTKVGNIPWQAKFNIGHHIAQTLVKDNVVLIGDAAHIHSPFGGRGMNLGLQDAYLCANAIHNNQLAGYSEMRKPYLQKTVGRINAFTTMATADSGFRLFLKQTAGLAKPFLPLFRPAMRKFVTGLD